jgi:RND family efflux transporter MFP subunit
MQLSFRGLAFTLFSGLIALLAGGCRETPQAQPPAPDLVDVARLEPADFEMRQPVSGLLEPRRASTLAFETSGRVEEVLVDLGDAVEEGQVLVRLDTQFLETALEQARLNEELARKNLERAEKLSAGGATTAEQLDQLRTRARLAEQRLREAELTLERATLRSPFTGRVRRVLVEVREFVSPGTPAVEVLDLTPMQLTVTVPESKIARVKPGAPARITFDALGTREPREVTVSRVAPGPAGEAPLFEVEIELPNEDGNLVAGMLGTGHVVTGELRDVWRLPLNALIVREGRSAVMTARDGHAHLLTLPEGYRRNRGFALVPAETWPEFAQAGALPLIVRGHKTLRPGAPVQIYEEPAPPRDVEPDDMVPITRAPGE